MRFRGRRSSWSQRVRRRVPVVEAGTSGSAGVARQPKRADPQPRGTGREASVRAMFARPHRADFPSQIAGTSAGHSRRARWRRHRRARRLLLRPHSGTGAHRSRRRIRERDNWDSFKQIAVKATNNPYQAVSGVTARTLFSSTPLARTSCTSKRTATDRDLGVDRSTTCRRLKSFASAILGRHLRATGVCRVPYPPATRGPAPPDALLPRGTETPHDGTSCPNACSRRSAS